MINRQIKSKFLAEPHGIIWEVKISISVSLSQKPTETDIQPVHRAVCLYIPKLRWYSFYRMMVGWPVSVVLGGWPYEMVYAPANGYQA